MNCASTFPNHRRKSSYSFKGYNDLSGRFAAGLMLTAVMMLMLVAVS